MFIFLRKILWPFTLNFVPVLYFCREGVMTSESGHSWMRATEPAANGRASIVKRIEH